MSCFDPYLPQEAEIMDYQRESETIFTLTTRFRDNRIHFSFTPGQFNMLSLYGVGEIPISISSDPDEKQILKHTIRAVGRVTKAMQETLYPGQMIGIRGPFGQGWPLALAENKDVLIITGGLGCAPAVSVIDYIVARRERYQKLFILQGVKHSFDFIFHDQYARWKTVPNTTVLVAADKASHPWPWYQGYVTDLLGKITLSPEKTVVMMCGPELMMHSAIQALTEKGVEESAIFLSMERNMQCAIGHCGHCQVGPWFVCKDGPVFNYPKVKPLFHVQGF